MICACEEYRCGTAYINPCSEGANIGVKSLVSGNVAVKVLFNGIVNSSYVNVTIGEDIIIPTKALNENYVHEVRIYSGSTLIECLKVTTFIDYNSTEYPVPPPIDPTMPFVKEYTGNGTNSQSFPELSGKKLIDISTQAGSYNKDFWTQSGNIVTWVDPYMNFYNTITLTWIEE